MKKFKDFNFLYLSLGILILSTIFISLFNFINLFSDKLSNALIYIIFFILLILNNYKIALKSKDKGIISGIKIATIVTIIIIIFRLILGFKFSLSTIIYLVLIYIFSCIPAIYGANKKSSSS